MTCLCKFIPLIDISNCLIISSPSANSKIINIDQKKYEFNYSYVDMFAINVHNAMGVIKPVFTILSGYITNQYNLFSIAHHSESGPWDDNLRCQSGPCISEKYSMQL